MSSPSLISKIESEETTFRLAVLIDADNAQASVIEGLLAEIARVGEATVRRIYGDFTAPTSAIWKKVLQKYAIKPVQQFAYTAGKNATDSMLIIDAMDLMYTRKFDGFCLVSSDSDFTGLAMRLREEGLLVLGFGERKTPEAFRNICHKFVFTEVLRPSPGEDTDHHPQNADQKQSDNLAQMSVSQPELKNGFPQKFLMTALEQSIDDAGWAHLGTFGSYLNKLQPDFDPRLYGYKKLSDLVRAKTDLFIMQERMPPGSNQKVLYIRAKDQNLSDDTALLPVVQPELKNEFPKKFLMTALEQSIDDAGWAHLGTFGSYLNKLQPDFDSRLYGYKKLSDLVKAKTDLFVTQERALPGSNQKVLYIRARNA